MKLSQDSVDEISDFCEYGVAQFHAEQASAEGSAEVFLTTLQHGGRQIRLLTKQPEKSGTVGGVLVVTGQSASGPDGDRQRYGVCAWCRRA